MKSEGTRPGTHTAQCDTTLYRRSPRAGHSPAGAANTPTILLSHESTTNAPVTWGHRSPGQARSTGRKETHGSHFCALPLEWGIQGPSEADEVVMPHRGAMEGQRDSRGTPEAAQHRAGALLLNECVLQSFTFYVPMSTP